MERDRRGKGKGKRKGKERERERERKGEGRRKECKGKDVRNGGKGGRRRDGRFFCSSLDDNVQTSLPDCSAAPAPLPGAAGLFTFMVVAACT